MKQRDILGDAFGLLTKPTRSSFLLVVVLAAISATYDVIRVSQNMTFGWIDSVYLALYVPAVAVVIYRLIVNMAPAPPTMSGFARFWGGVALTLLPLGAGLGSLALLPKGGGWLVTPPLVGCGVGIIAIVLLQGWPVAMATAKRWISPLQIMRATKGHRWRLLVCFFIFGVGNRLPGPEAGRTLMGNLGCGLLEAGLVTLQIFLIAAISVAAWKAVVANDSELRQGPHLN